MTASRIRIIYRKKGDRYYLVKNPYISYPYQIFDRRTRQQVPGRSYLSRRSADETLDWMNEELSHEPARVNTNKKKEVRT